MRLPTSVGNTVGVGELSPAVHEVGCLDIARASDLTGSADFCGRSCERRNVP